LARTALRPKGWVIFLLLPGDAVNVANSPADADATDISDPMIAAQSPATIWIDFLSVLIVVLSLLGCLDVSLLRFLDRLRHKKAGDLAPAQIASYRGVTRCLAARGFPKGNCPGSPLTSVRLFGFILPPGAER
jgi:hypothetical protein